MTEAQEKIVKQLMQLSDALDGILSEMFGEPMGCTLIVWPKSKGPGTAMIAGNMPGGDVKLALEVALKTILNEPHLKLDAPTKH